MADKPLSSQTPHSVPEAAANGEPERPALGDIRERIAVGASFVCLCLALAVFGAVSSKLAFFPGRQVNEFLSSFKDVRQLVELHWQYKVLNRHPNEITWPDGLPAHAPIKSQIGADELTLVQAFRNGSYGLFLVGADGLILHEWRIPPVVSAEFVKPSDRMMPGDFKVIDGALLFPNGDVAITVDYYGVARLDRCSHKIWSLPGEYHHSISIGPDGDLWVPFREFRTATKREESWISAPYFYESVAQISPDGVLKETFPLVDAAIAGRFEGLIAVGSPGDARTLSSDITHLNDADIVTAEFAATNPQLNEGDIIVSLRTVDAIAVIDRMTKKFKFALSGLTVRQHDPDILPNGNILLFDNRTVISQHNRLTYTPHGQALGQSRIVEINPRTQETVWSWSGSDAAPFFSSIQGKIEPLANGNVLVAETEGGRIFEIDRASGAVIWQFENLLRMENGAPVYGRVTGASRHARSDLPFLTEPACPALPSQ